VLLYIIVLEKKNIKKFLLSIYNFIYFFGVKIYLVRPVCFSSFHAFGSFGSFNAFF
jgi:hypothetical protein